MLTNTERQQIVEEVNAGTYGIDEALDDIAAAQKGEEVRKALYAEALVLNREGHAGSTDMIARQQIANLQTSVNGQISTLRTEVGDDIDDLETALNSGLATQNGRIAAQNATIANVVKNYNLEYGSETLWEATGETGLLASGTTATLSKDVSNFDYVDIYSFCGNSNVLDTVPVDAKLQSSQGYALRWVNLSDPDSGSYKAYVRIIETRLHIIGTTLTIDHQVTYRNGEEVNISGAEITQSNRSTYMGELGIMKIVGRKITANTEVEDIRVGADGTDYSNAGEAVRTQVNDVKEDLSYSENATKSGYNRLKHMYINSSGVVTAVAESAIGGIYDYDLICYQVVPGKTIQSITIEASIYGFFVAKPFLESVTYDNSRVILNGGTYTNISIPESCNWVAFRVPSGSNLTDYSAYSFIDYLRSDIDDLEDDVGDLTSSLNDLNTSAIKTIGTISTGDLNDYTNNGIYEHEAGATVSNAPSDGGRLIVSKIGLTIVQIYYATRVSTGNYGKVFYRILVGATIRDWVRIDGGNSTKIAFFGDSVLWGAVKTINGSSYTTTQANPTPVQTIGNILHAEVGNFAISGMGYVKRASENNKNIYEMVQDTNLTGYTHVCFMAGDNDSSLGSSVIGNYTDTTEGTMMGNIYLIMEYLHANYPSIIPIIINKNNKIAAKSADGTAQTAFGTFPDFYYGYTYNNGFSISDFHQQVKAFCEYYGVANITMDMSGLSGWLLENMVGPDQTHYSQNGYNLYGRYIAGQLRQYIG